MPLITLCRPALTSAFTTIFTSAALLRNFVRLVALPFIGIVVLSLSAMSAMSAMAAPAQQSSEDRPSQEMVVDDRVSEYELWPAMTLLRDPAAKLTLAEVLARRSDFLPPKSAYATLGLRMNAVWLRIPVFAREGGDGRWIFDVDYALLNFIDVYVLRDGEVVQRAALGNGRPLAGRPIKGRSHAVALNFTPGATHELLIRVETIGAMILPMKLSKLSAFHERAVNEQMLQGVLASVVLCLLIYSLLQWLSLREHLYINYSLLLIGSGLFSVHFFGVGTQFLWPDNLWAERHLAGIFSLLAAIGTALFIEEVLGSDLRATPRTALKLVAGLMAGVAVLHGLGVLDIFSVSVEMATLGLSPSLIGLPGAIARIRRGDSVGTYFMVAWLGYFAVSAIMIGVVKGVISANFWTLHAFQFGATVDMLIFIRIAVLRTNAIHLAAQRVSIERDALHSLAHSDPLTGVLNRRGLSSTLNLALSNCAAERMLAVYLLDLDQFKPVNDRYGHDVGDELLVAVSARLRACMRSGDVVARLGGDEFVILASGMHSEQQANDLGHKLLEAFAAPFQLSKHTCEIGCTIGYTLAPNDGIDAINLLKNADAAMYAGKEAGKNCVRRGAATVGL